MNQFIPFYYTTFRYGIGYLLPVLEPRLVGLLLVPAEEDLADGVPAADEIVVADGDVLNDWVVLVKE